jgi:hypothetical protein
MKVTKTSIYKLTVQKDCGCLVCREFTDESLTTVYSGIAFYACGNASHAPEAAGDIIRETLGEVLDTEAKAEEAKIKARTQAAQAEVRTQRIAARTGGTPGPALATPPEGGTVDVTPLPNRPNRPHRPSGGGGSSSARIARVPAPRSAAEAIAARSGQVGKVAAVEIATLNLEEAEEDPRVTKILQATLLNDDGDDDEELF